MIPEERIIREVLAAWRGGLAETRASWAQHCTPDMVWWNSARGRIEGLDACLSAIDAIDQVVNGFAYIDVPIRELMAQPGMVMVERSDDLYRADDTLIKAVPVTAVIKFDGAKIIEWRDYCVDWLAEFLPEATPSLP